MGALAATVAFGEPVVLRSDEDVIPAGDLRYDRFELKDQLPATVACVFGPIAPGRAVVELMTLDNLHALLQGGPYEPIATSDSGELRQEIGVPGVFAVVVKNPDKSRETRVKIRLTLDFQRSAPAPARYLEPKRKLTVILVSFFGFLTVITLSARKLLLSMRR